MTAREDVKNIFISLLNVKPDEFGFEKNQEDYSGWDSFVQLELVSKIEKKFSIDVDIEEAVELDTPQKFLELVESKLK